MSDPRELKGTGLKGTVPRLKVLDLFQHSTERHLSAEDVYRKRLEEHSDVGLATGYLVALVEWACIELIKPHLDWPREQSLGTHVDLSHTAATPPGFTVEVRTRLESVEGRKLVFAVSASDGVDAITEGRHERHV